ncbi:hypothetical protein CPT_Moby_253 [Stenotrophomonas phage Moby]|uniref:Uncharacterized protein n=1 Tax=Stenotrophomonas phage Moby TaxID=2601680 RepID=A0A5P8PMK7_9CAUD|nr:hypothetical protein HWC58_gp145 [Stenotrophomonas phage Moby]QFR57978.1 hypothetical protein CPT_Moby_253 [Stenotrophomonas phage Moby]
MTNKMRFKMVNPQAYQLYNLEDAMDMAFGLSLEYGDYTHREIVDLFTSMEIGETLIDEDQDEWVRVEDAE